MPFNNLQTLVERFSGKYSLINAPSLALPDISIEKLEIRNISISICNELIDIIISGKFTSEYNYKELIRNISSAFNSADEMFFNSLDTFSFDSIDEIPSIDEEQSPIEEKKEEEFSYFPYDIRDTLKDCTDCILYWLEKTNNLSKIVLKDIVNNDTTWINKDTSLLISEDIYLDNYYSNSSDLSSYIKTFNNIINLYYIDFNLNWSLDQLLKLSYIKLFLDSREALDYFSSHPGKRTALKCKVDFLSFKIIRANNRKNDDLKLFDYENISSINEKEYSKNLQTSDHYDILISNDDINQKHQAIKHKDYAEYTYQDFFIKTKYFKHNYTSNPKFIIDSLKTTLNEFEKHSKHKAITNFDKWAYERTYIFIYNNWLSLKLKSNSITLKNIEELFEETIDKQLKFNVKNYYPFLKLCTFIKTNIYNLIQTELTNLSLNNIDGSNLSIIRAQILLLEESTKHLEQCIKWSELHLNWAFQPDFNSCTDTIKPSSTDNPIDIFNASAFIIPINYNNVKEDASLIKEDIKHFKSQIEILKTTNLLNKRLDSKMKEVDGISKKNVEILSVFAAIVLFTIGNIQIYKEANSIKDALLFMISFAYVIGIFVLLIRQITKENEQRNKTEIKVIWTLIISTVIVIGYLFWSNPTPSLFTEKNKDKTQERLNPQSAKNSQVQQQQPSNNLKNSASKQK